MSDTDWPFDQAANVAAVSNAGVLDRKSPILFVVHYSDDDSWAFLDGGPFAVAEGRVIGMGTALKIDPSLREIADLLPGWTARRSHVGGPWVRDKDDEV